MATTHHIAVRIDVENNADEFWSHLFKVYPAFADSLSLNGAAVIDARLWESLVSLPGFDGGPEYAPYALIDCGGEGEQWADVVAGRHQVFDALS
jgi:hypothetical protein